LELLPQPSAFTAPHVIVEDIAVDLETALENFGAIAQDVKR